MVSGSFAGLDQAGVADTFSALQQDPIQSVLFMAAIILIGIVICSLGLQNGVERITKIDDDLSFSRNAAFSCAFSDLA